MRPRRSILERLERLGIDAEPSELLTRRRSPPGAARRRATQRFRCRARRAPRGPGGHRGGRRTGRRRDRRGPRRQVGLRGAEPGVSPGDGGGGSDRATEEPLLGDGRGTLPGCWAIRRGDRDASGREAEVVGKPAPAFFDSPSRISVSGPTRGDGRRRCRGRCRRSDGGGSCWNPCADRQVPGGSCQGSGSSPRRLDSIADVRAAQAELDRGAAHRGRAVGEEGHAAS